MFLRLEGATVLESCENRSWLCLSDCHLAVSWSWAGHHTSFERGVSGLPADMKIRTIVQLIGILWSYFGMLWGLPTTLYILVCHSATFRNRAGYHMANERGHPKLSYEVQRVDFHPQAAQENQLWPFILSSPRNSKCSKLPLTFQEHHLIYLIARHRSNIRKGVVSGQNFAKRTSVTQI